MHDSHQNTEKMDLSFSIKNFGHIHHGEWIQKPLTVFCGPNNSGKTWVMYALHAFYRNAALITLYKSGKLKEILRKTQNEGWFKTLSEQSISLQKFNKDLETGLHYYFNTAADVFQDAKFSCTIADDQWENWMRSNIQPNIFLMPAERNGLHLFYRELSNKRTALLHHASKSDINVGELLRDVIRSPYAKPIADYIDWLNELSTQPKTSGSFHHEAATLQKQLTEGRYGVDRQTGDVTYYPYQKKRGVETHQIGLHTASSVVKSLFGLWFYLEYQAKSGDILMIDEPELNIHPANQRLLSHLFARLVNAGIKVVISTHSDYIVRELNNLFLLSEDTNGSLLKSLNQNQKKNEISYEENAILQPDKAGMYFFDQHTIKPFKYTPGEGFAISTFDEVIVNQNQINAALYYGLKGEEEE